MHAAKLLTLPGRKRERSETPKRDGDRSRYRREKRRVAVTAIGNSIHIYNTPGQQPNRGGPEPRNINLQHEEGW